VSIGRWTVVLAAIVAPATGCGGKRGSSDEELRRDAFARDLLVREGMKDAYGVSSRFDVRFEQGFSPIEYDPPAQFRAKAFRWIGQRGVVRVRSHGDRPMNLGAYGWIDPTVVRSRPVASLSIDGQFVASTVVDERGLFWVGSGIPAQMVRRADWLTVDINLSSVGFHWDDPPKLQVANLLLFRWEELEPPR
jgi:hypothetical protein